MILVLYHTLNFVLGALLTLRNPLYSNHLGLQSLKPCYLSTKSKSLPVQWLPRLVLQGQFKYNLLFVPSSYHSNPLNPHNFDFLHVLELRVIETEDENGEHSEELA